MTYSRVQKSLSFLLLFLLFFSVTIRVPLPSFFVNAGTSSYYDLVSIIVDEDTYRETGNKIRRYAEDIQSVRENTRVAIFPTPLDATPFQIASLNESLYFEWYRGVQEGIWFESRLVWTLLIGSIDVPLLSEDNKSFYSIFPYTDFEDKAYIYNHASKKYEKNTNLYDEAKAEIWHGVIAPNTWDTDVNIQAIQDYFDKNHDFYKGTGNFKFSDSILNGNPNLGVKSSYEPSVFYFDSFREKQWLNPNSFLGYESYLENKEDILYNRFSQELAEKIQSKTLSGQEDILEEFSSLLEDTSSLSSSPDISESPDIQLRHIIEKVTEPFAWIFAKGTLAEMRADVHNAWRYNRWWNDVGVDFIPYFITVLDLVNDEIVKEANKDIEEYINTIVEWWLARKVAVFAWVEENNECKNVYSNYLYGKKVADFQDALDCSIYRWNNIDGGQLVEANRWLNVNNIDSDSWKLGESCTDTRLYWYFGWNTPLNLDTSTLRLKSSSLTNAIQPLFDIEWSYAIDDTSKIPSPLACKNANLLLTLSENGTVTSGGNSTVRLCQSFNLATASTANICSKEYIVWTQYHSQTYDFENFYVANPANSIPPSRFPCDEVTITHSNTPSLYTIKKQFWVPEYLNRLGNQNSRCIEGWFTEYSYRFIPSSITHTSPTYDELTEQINNMITPNLPIDKDRYIDFISAKWNYKKVLYPALFRLWVWEDESLNEESIRENLKKVLDEKSQEINALITSENPEELQGGDIEIYNLLKDGVYPDTDIDIYAYIESKADKEITLDSQTKTTSYLDALNFALYWNNLSNISAKYQFVIDHYLSDQFLRDDISFPLPKNKKLYEIAYLWAPGDSDGMYVKLDPNEKTAHPYDDIVSANMELDASLLGDSVASWNNSDDPVFVCAPPGWVELQDWFPAVQCWLENMLPATIGLSEGQCAGRTLFLSDEEKQEYEACSGDGNKNGVDDCIENNLKDSVLELSAENSKYYFGKNGTLNARVKDKDWKNLTFLNSTKIRFELVRVVDPSLEWASRIIFDTWNPYKQDETLFAPYLDFQNKWESVLQWWAGSYGFLTKNIEADLYFQAFIEVEDAYDKTVVSLESSRVEVLVRGERLFLSSTRLENDNDGLFLYSWENSIEADDTTNIFLVDTKNTPVSWISNLINNSSESSEKLVFGLENIWKDGEQNDITYPISVKVVHMGIDSIPVLERSIESIDNFVSLIALRESWTYQVEVKDADDFWVRKEIEILPWALADVRIDLGSKILETGWSTTTNLFSLFDSFQNITWWELYKVKLSLDGDGLLFQDNKEKTLEFSTFEWFWAFRIISTDEEAENTLSLEVFDGNDTLLMKQEANIQTLNDIFLVATPNFSSDTLKVWEGSYSFQVSLRDKTGNMLEDIASRVYLSLPEVYGTPNQVYSEFEDAEATLSFSPKKVAAEDITLSFQVEGVGKIFSKQVTILPEDPIKMDISLSENQLSADGESKTDVFVELKDRYGNLVFSDNTTQVRLEILDRYKNIISSKTKETQFQKWVATFQIFVSEFPGTGYFKVSTDPSLSSNYFEITDTDETLTLYWVWEQIGRIETFSVWDKTRIKNQNYNALYTLLLGSSYGNIFKKDYLAGSILFEKDNRALAVSSILSETENDNGVLHIERKWNIKKIYGREDLSQDIELGLDTSSESFLVTLFNASLSTLIGNVVYTLSPNTELLICEDEFCEVSENESSLLFVGSDLNYNASLVDDTLIIKNGIWTRILELGNTGKIKRFWNTEVSVNENNTNEYLSLSITHNWAYVWEIQVWLKNGEIHIYRDDTSFNRMIDTQEDGIHILLKTARYSGNMNLTGVDIVYESFLEGDTASQWDGASFNNFSNRQGIWWKEENKTLLAFASSMSVGEATKPYASLGLINLGDPLVALKKIQKDIPGTSIPRQFDSTIWTLLTDDRIEAYQVFDYDADGRDDILTLKEGNLFWLLENKAVWEWFISKWNLAKVVDLWKKDLVATGDFSWDDYDDIFFVNSDGKPFLLNNHTKDFVRISLEREFDIEGRIVRTAAFDMDNDTRDDIITLDDSGKIHIFYGWWTSRNPVFSKLLVSDDYGIDLSSKIRNDGWFVYFDELYQLQPQEPQLDNISTEILDKEIFTQLSISTQNLSVDENPVTFIKSQYGKSVGIEVTKRFLDTNSWSLQSGDQIDVEVILRNVSPLPKNNVIYAETIEDIFSLQRESIEVSKRQKDRISFETDLNISPSFDIPSSSFAIESMTLNPWDEIKIEYTLLTRPIEFWYLEAWLFEKWELWDDSFGDIIMKKDYRNCSHPVEIFRSIESRTYRIWLKVPSCNEDAAALPPEIEPNTIDINENWIPDYIDELRDQENEEARMDYANSSLEVINEIDDYDDTRSVEEKIDAALDKTEDFMQWLSCWFGWGWCIATPLNWAPLAPGWDPTLFWKPIWDGFRIDEGLPVFSALTGWPLPTPAWPIPMPWVWPPFPGSYPNYASPWAWGWLGVDNPANFIRIFATPTLTWGFGTAVCFGGPARVAGYANPPGLAPLQPGGNCIVTAKPLAFCSGDGSDGDPSSLGNPQFSPNGSFGLIHGNCSAETGKRGSEFFLTDDIADQYYRYKRTGKISDDTKQGLEEFLEISSGIWAEEYAFENDASYNSNYSNDGTREPLFSINGWSAWDTRIEVWLDLSGIADDGDFSDIVEIEQTRISPFPSFLMSWWTRQIEEIVNKLTDFPTVFVILPDFSGIFDGAFGDDPAWGQNSGNISQDYRAESWLQEAYQFLANIPLITLEEERVWVNIPWLDKETIDKTLISWKQTVEQWKDELNRAKDEWNFFGACKDEEKSDIDIQKCQEQQKLWEKVSLDVSWLITSLERNIEILESYKSIPEELNSLFSKKEEYLEQVMCNVEAISSLSWEWISTNGERFKAWVELYVLIKAILKSWQALIDVFLDFEAECRECQNERWDLIGFQFQLIDFLIPQIPVIEFPKWPDIVLDLHNIRAGITIVLPEFDIQERPVLLPTLPELRLPNVPNININLPSLAILPEIEIGELRDLPTLPSIELPNLPPPPKLPKIFASFEGVLSIIKLITRVMCILKTSPFVPEWRAWDQIAFLTERQWYLSFDFALDINLPQFSFPSLDRIKVTSYVNFEFETDALITLANELVTPVNNFTSNLFPLLQVTTNDLDFSEIIPSDINVDISSDWTTINEKSVEIDNWVIKIWDEESFVHPHMKLAWGIAAYVMQGYESLKNEKDDVVSHSKFKEEVFKNLASPLITREPKMARLLGIWEEVASMTYSKEDKLIEELEDASRDKFDFVLDILNNEILEVRETEKKLRNIWLWIPMQVSSHEQWGDFYKSGLEKHNESFRRAARELVSASNKEKEVLQREWQKILKANNAIGESFTSTLSQSQREKHREGGQGLLASTLAFSSWGGWENTCQAQQRSQYKYNYEWIYVIEGQKSYRLFDYLEWLEWDEVTKSFDYDKDGDDDILYMVNGELYIKENQKEKRKKSYVSTPPLIHTSHKFYSGDFIEAINRAKESGWDSGAINIEFLSRSWEDTLHYRLEFFDRVDKFLNVETENYIPEFIKSVIIDSFASLAEATLLKDFSDYTLRKNMSYLSILWSNTRWVTLHSREWKNLSDDVRNNVEPLLTPGTKVYAAGESFRITYTLDGEDQAKGLYVNKYHHIEIKKYFACEGYKLKCIYSLRWKNIWMRRDSFSDFFSTFPVR